MSPQDFDAIGMWFLVTILSVLGASLGVFLVGVAIAVFLVACAATVFCLSIALDMLKWIWGER